MSAADQPTSPLRSAGPSRRLLRRVARRLLPARGLTAPGLNWLLGVRAEHGHVVDVVQGLKVEYSLDSLIGQLLFMHGEFEEPEAVFIESRLKLRAGAVVLDVGANIGLHSLRAARLHEVGQVFAFEPGRATFAMLERNIARNRLAEKIRAYPLAVSARAGRADFHFCADDAYSSLTPDNRRPVQQTYAVTVTSLDEWCAAEAIDRIDLIKIDVEGGEADVIAGALAVLTRHRPELIVEIFQGDRRGFSAVGLIDKICALGYEPFVLVDGRAVPFTRHDDRHFNYHFVARR